MPSTRRWASRSNGAASCSTNIWRPGECCGARPETCYEGGHTGLRDVSLEPKPFRAGGPCLWFGGETIHEATAASARRVRERVQPARIAERRRSRALRSAMTAAGRDMGELEMVGGTRGRFADADWGRPTSARRSRRYPRSSNAVSRRSASSRRNSSTTPTRSVGSAATWSSAWTRSFAEPNRSVHHARLLNTCLLPVPRQALGCRSSSPTSAVRRRARAEPVGWAGRGPLRARRSR